MSTTLGPYELLAPLAKGGMGVVYKARHRSLGREVAIKLLAGAQAVDPARKERFAREVLAQARLSHPGIVQVHDVGMDKGVPWVAMELVRGGSLRDLLEKEKKLAPKRALELTVAIARALQAAHEEAIVHRDLKPENVLLDERGQPKIADFGVAKMLATTERGERLTRTGDIVGTPQYMAPEQTMGRGELIDARTDVWALGVLLYEMLAGKPPFRGGNMILLVAQVLSADPEPPLSSDVLGRDAATIALRALEKEREGRYESALELAEDCERALRGEPIEARRAGALARVARRVRREPGFVVAGAALLVLAVGGTVFHIARQSSLVAQLQENEKKLEETIQSLEAARAKASRSLEAQRCLAEASSLHAQWAKREAVRAKVDRAVELQPDEATFSEAARILLDAHDEDRARDLLEECVRRCPPSYKALIALSVLDQQQGKPPGENSAVERILRIAKERGDENKFVHYIQGERAMEKGKPDLAIEEYSKAIALDPGYAVCLLQRGVLLERAGKVHEALADFERAVEANPGLPIARLNRAQARRALKNFAGARTDLDFVFERDGGLRAHALEERASLSRDEGRLQDAIADADALLAIDWSHARSFALRAELAHAVGDQETILRCCDRALQLDPNEPMALTLRIGARLKKGEKDGALADAERLLSVKGANAETLTNRALVRWDRGDREAALADVERALAIDPRAAPVYVLRGDFRNALGNSKGAQEDWEKGLELDPSLAELVRSRLSRR